VYIRLAFDGFESEGRDGGSGWLGPWQTSHLFVTRPGDAHSGDFQLDLSFSGFVQRVADLGGHENVHLRFWARLSSLQAPAKVWASGDLNQWQVVKEFTLAESDGLYHLYDIDLSGMVASGSFSVVFESQLYPLVSQWHVDDVEFVALAP